jgi:transcriptional regulator with XRE-family HTH domain
MQVQSGDELLAHHCSSNMDALGRRKLLYKRLKLMKKLSIKNIDLSVGKRIREIRSQCGISQERLGEELGVSFQQIQKYERGLNRISAGKLCAVAKFCNMPISAFFDEDIKDMIPTEKQRQCMALARAASGLKKGQLRLVHNFVDGLSKEG